MGSEVIVTCVFLLCVRIIDMNNGHPPLTYRRFQALLSCMEPPPKPQETITTEVMGNAKTPISDDHDDIYSVPTLEELGEAQADTVGVIVSILFVFI